MAADKSKSFDNFSSSEQCDFAEIVNKSSKLLTLDGISLVNELNNLELNIRSIPMEKVLYEMGFPENWEAEPLWS